MSLKNCLPAGLLVFSFACTSVQTQRPELHHPVARKSQPKSATKKSPATETKPVITPITSQTAPPAVEGSPQSVQVKTKVDLLKEDFQKHPENLEVYKDQIHNFNDLELDSAINTADMGTLRAFASLEKSHRLEAKNDLEGSIRALEDVERFAPGSTVATDAQKRVQDFQVLYQVNKDTIGALLPLTGKNAQQGQKVVRALQMGLGITDDKSEFKLKVIDSEGQPAAAETALHKLVFTEHPIAVVGPLLSKTATAVADECELYKVPCVSLSQRSQITLNKEYVFSHSLTSGQLAQFLVKKAVEKGAKKFAVMYPNDLYGVEYANAFWDEVLLQGGQVTAIQPYDSNETDLRYPAERLVSSFYIESRKDEFTDLDKELKKNANTRQNTSVDDVLPPLIDFDAVFIPDSAKEMGQVSAFLSYVGVKKISLLGTNLWNVPGLAKRAQNFKDSTFFADIYNPEDSEINNLPFFKAYFEKFGEYPGPLEVHAYEIGTILRQGLKRTIPNRQVMASYLSHIDGFEGIFGKLTMNPRHQLERPLTLYSLEKDEIKAIK